MPRLPRITASQIISILEKHGFKLVRQSGSHKIFRNAEGKRTTVPFHDNKILHPKILKSIIKDAEIESEDLK
jgi:predicted RNA binding protein YcfA (HicA-like mRNA interferase family)